MFLEARFRRLVERIRSRAEIPLRLELWNGDRFDLAPSPTVTIAIPRSSALRFFFPPDLNKLGEAFVEGHIRVEGSIKDAFRAAESLARVVTGRTRAGFHHITRHSRQRDREAIEYHYDVSNDFYALFLDRGMVYSCGYFRDDADSLDTAQEQKIDHILGKLMLKPGERLLDIGCGWGALVMRAASRYGAHATGITLSKNQLAYARERIKAAGLEARCRVELCDFRDAGALGRFDKITSVGMFEHVGLKNLRTYFKGIHDALNEGGIVLNHGITASDPASRWTGLGAGEFIDRYVFPDGELPHISLVLREMAEAGFEVADVESLRRHYARTCDAWSTRLEANAQRALQFAGERRLRIWQIYLAGCAHAFNHGWMNIYQVLGRRARDGLRNVLPMTRDYMYRT